MFYNPEISSVYDVWIGKASTSSTQLSMGLDIGLGAAFLIIGFMLSFGLYLYQKKHNKESNSL